VVFKRINKFNSRCRQLALAVFISYFLLCDGIANAQSFKNADIKLYDFFNTFFIQETPVEVNGLPNNMTENFGLETVSFTIQHTKG
jgi:hypothetical protein